MTLREMIIESIKDDGWADDDWFKSEQDNYAYYKDWLNTLDDNDLLLAYDRVLKETN